MVVIILFIDGVMRHVDQLVDDILVILRQRLSHLASRVFRRDEFRDLDQTDQYSRISLLFILGALVFFQHPFGIIDQRGEIVFLPLGKVAPECQVYFRADNSGSVSQYMQKRFRLSVQIAQKMLRSLRQVQDRL